LLYKIAFSSPPNHICNKVSVLWTSNIRASQSSISAPILIQIQNKEISTHNTTLVIDNVLEYRPWLVPRDERSTDLFYKDMACNYIINVYSNYVQGRHKNTRNCKMYSIKGTVWWTQLYSGADTIFNIIPAAIHSVTGFNYAGRRHKRLGLQKRKPPDWCFKGI
jgi:hypothetical protein